MEAHAEQGRRLPRREHEEEEMRAYYRDAQEGYLLLTQYQPEHPSSSCIGGDLKSINRGGVFLVTTSPKIRILLEQPSISYLGYVLSFLQMPQHVRCQRDAEEEGCYGGDCDRCSVFSEEHCHCMVVSII